LYRNNRRKEILIIHEQQTSFIQEVKLTEQRKEGKEEKMKEIKSTMTRKKEGKVEWRQWRKE